MYTVLVVDDEKLARQDVLYKIGKSGFPFDWIMEAEDAEEAFEIVEANHPDIIFTDIMMGEKSGLDFLEDVNRVYPEIVTVIVCGYPDFSFARRALSLQVFEYLLKPVKEKTLIDILNQAIQEVNHRKELTDLSVQNAFLQTQLQNVSLRQSMNESLRGAGNVDMEAMRLRLPKDVKWFQLQIIRIKKVVLDEKDDSTDLLRFCVRNIAEELSNNYFLTFDGMHPNIVIALAGSNQLVKESAEKSFLHLGVKIVEAMARMFQSQVFIGTSRTSEDVAATFYLEAQQSLDFRFNEKSPDNGFVSYRDFSPVSDEDFFDVNLTTFRNFLENGDAKNAVTTANYLLEQYHKKGLLNLRGTYTSLISLLTRSCYKKGVMILPFLGYENTSGAILDQLETFHEITENLKTIIETAIGQWVVQHSDTSDIMKQVKLHIENHFMDSEICTKALSREFCISLGYLSASYRKTFGTTISKYITIQRMKYAGKLLEDTEISIQNISEKCGFNNLSYFMRVFKSHYQITPAQFRNNQK